MRTYRAAIIGIGGFGAAHVNVLMDLVHEGRLEVTAFAELNASAYQENVDKLTAIGAIHYTDYEQMLEEHPEIDFVVIATPIASHKSMCIRVLEMGFHVLVEKPPAVTIQDLDEMIAARQASGRLCQVNFQNTAGSAFKELLARLNAGEIGDVSQVTGIGMWKRSKAYYGRTPWAGRLTYREQYVLDGTLNNPLAHLLNNCLLAAGASRGQSRMLPEWVQAELYHVNEIEGDDVSCMRIRTDGGVTVLFYAMLCHEDDEIPSIAVRGMEGEMIWSYDNKLTIRSGSEEEVYSYGSENMMRGMYLNLLQAIEDTAVPLLSPIEASRSFVLAANGAYESSLTVRRIPREFVEEREEGQTSVCLLPGLSERMREIAGKGLLYSEFPLPWASPTKPVRMEDYCRFQLPSGYEAKVRD
ncbi:Gfo/Idh/MocA family protein [Paenibacillus spongiae]|uniref:Gfo/Idh/MocA family oxidoreductase n=1 Tax=Paenibacillus spongiae TaxID=2909671 RepID=A0ABY5SDH2_9BACL|nr:Gfo/Idh/MocA family oxidoreductase [Paenibacillus spongiae]UVI32001.1 Gfo/Idh/MocA family oxidoreductase [Paenibacillus spongiae]